MEADSSDKLVRVVYWEGAAQREGLAADYSEAMQFASRNKNAFGPKFYEIATGCQLFDDGNGLCVENQSYYVV